jgi:hypothetical protein
MQKPYAPKCGQGKKIDLFQDFFTQITYVQVMKFPHCKYIQYGDKVWNKIHNSVM